MPPRQPLDLPRELLEGVDHAMRVTEHLVSVVPDALWRARPPASEGRTIAADRRAHPERPADVREDGRSQAVAAGPRPPEVLARRLGEGPGGQSRGARHALRARARRGCVTGERDAATPGQHDALPRSARRASPRPDHRAPAGARSPAPGRGRDEAVGMEEAPVKRARLTHGLRDSNRPMTPINRRDLLKLVPATALAARLGAQQQSGPDLPPPADLYLVARGALRDVRALGTGEPARHRNRLVARQGGARRRVRRALPAIQPDRLRRGRLGAPGEGLGDEVPGAHHQAPRRVLPLGQQRSPITTS